MLIPFNEILAKYNLKPTGVMHIGASTGQESEAYFNGGVRDVVFVEVIPDVYRRLCEHVARFPFHSAILVNECITDVDGKEFDFKISSNDGESSSIFDFGIHANMHPDVSFVDEITVTSKTMRTVINERNIDMKKYQFLNVDLQGADLLAIKSLDSYINAFDAAYIEVNAVEIYRGNPLVGEVDAYMEQCGFVHAETKWVQNNWGDRLYIRK